MTASSSVCRLRKTGWFCCSRSGSGRGSTAGSGAHCATDAVAARPRCRRRAVEISRTIASPRSRWATYDGRAGTFSISSEEVRRAAAGRGRARGIGRLQLQHEPVVLVVGRREARVALGVEAVVVGDVAVRLAGQRRVADDRIDAGGGDGVAEVVGRRGARPDARQPLLARLQRALHGGAELAGGLLAPGPGRAAPCRRSRAPRRARCSRAGPAGRRRSRARTGPCGSRPPSGWSPGRPPWTTPKPRSLRCGSFRACASRASASLGFLASMSSAAASISGSGSRGLRSAVSRSAARAPLSALASRPAAASRSAPTAVLNSGLAPAACARGAPLSPATFCADASAAANVSARRRDGHRQARRRG